MKRARFLAAIIACIALSACDDSALPPGGTYQALSGIVVDGATNQPVAGAAVTVDTVLKQTTGADGKFSFPQVPVGDVDIEVTANGYKQYVQPARLEAGQPLSVTITLAH